MQNTRTDKLLLIQYLIHIYYVIQPSLQTFLLIRIPYKPNTLQIGMFPFLMFGFRMNPVEQNKLRASRYFTAMCGRYISFCAINRLLTTAIKRQSDVNHIAVYLCAIASRFVSVMPTCQKSNIFAAAVSSVDSLCEPRLLYTSALSCC